MRGGFSEMMMDKPTRQRGSRPGSGGSEDGLGANSDIGVRLRALYGSVQDESIPDRLLDLLEQLDSIELQQAKNAARND